MRVLHVLDHSIPLHSGYAFRTLALMREQRRLGWTPLLLTGPKQGAGNVLEETVEGWHFHRTLWRAGASARLPVVGETLMMRALHRRLRDCVRALQPAIVHAHSPVLNALPAWRVARELGLPWVYEVRAFWEDAAVEHGSCREGDMRYRATRAAETFALKRAHAVTTICDGLREAIEARGIDPGRITVIPNAVDAERFDAHLGRDEALFESLGLAGRYVLGFIGSFYRYEGLDIAIRALAEPALRPHDCVLLLVGGGPEEAHLKSLVEALGLTDRVIFTGRVPHDDIERYYGVMDLMVFPRLRHRLTELVTPLKPLEAMAQSRIVAASDVGGHRELIRDGDTAFLFEPESPAALAQRIAEICAMPGERLDRMRAAGRRFVEAQRTWRASAARYRDVYERLTGAAR